MAFDFDQQAHLYPLSGTSGFEDGAGMSAHIAHDLGFWLNNLGARVALKAQWPTSIAQFTPGYIEKPLHTASREIFMSQCPIMYEPSGSRMVWTAGIEGFASVGTTVISAVTAYVSRRRYTGAAAPDAFQGADPYSWTHARPRTKALAISTAGEQYELADDSVTGWTGGILTDTDDVKDGTAWLIVTVTGFNVNVGKARLFDFCLWPKFE